MDIKIIQKILLECYSKDLCYYKVKDEWNENNKCLGMCAITSLIINDYFGGDICKMHVEGISHYFNIIDNKVVDLTSSQFNYEINYNDYQIIDRNKMLTKDTKQRYNKLKSKLINKLLSEIDKEVYNCHKCENLVEKFPNDKTVFLGKDNDIVLVGEAPANNGWRKSHQLWKDINGKILPSGVVLQKLFDIIDKDIFETTFLESVKCYPLERKNLKVCSKYCKDIMLKQLRILNPKLIITLGEFPTRNLLNFKFGKFSDVVGNIYEVEGFKVLPIYHPSPISPKSYKGNVPIFDKLKEIKMSENNKQVMLNKTDDNLKNECTLGISSIIQSIEPFVEQANQQIAKYSPQIIEMTNSIQKIVESITEYIKPLIDQMVNSIPKISSYFEDLKKTIEELKKNPNSIFNWVEFSKKLSNYFWLPPYPMESKQIISLLQTVNSEEQMDIKLEQYFTTQLIDNLFNDIINMSLKKHTEILRQIKDSYNAKNYALANTGLFSVIDSLCAFFVHNKRKHTYRINLFIPILNVEKRKSDNYINILILTMLNSNINFLYGHRQNTHKLARRHLSQHGEFFSNNKIDTIMLLHTTYYLLICINIYKKYKSKLVLKKQIINKKTIKRYIIRSKSNNKTVT